MKRLTKEDVECELAALEGLDTKALKDKWASVYRRDPPPKIRARLLRFGIAYRLQELAFGGLKPQTVRLIKRLAAELRAQRVDKLAGTRAIPTPAASRRLSPGTRLIREWNGSMEIVDVIADGFEWRGTTYRTLTAVACAITGTKWSGPKFFGLAAYKAPRSLAPAPSSITSMEAAP